MLGLAAVPARMRGAVQLYCRGGAPYPPVCGAKLVTEDKIILQGMVFYGYHGVNPEERIQGQRFVVDLELSRDLSQAGRSDDLSATVNYSSVFKVAREVVEGEPCNLLEAVAERLADAVLARFAAEAVKVRIRKPWAPIKGSVIDWVAVEIVRRPAEQPMATPLP